MTTRVTSTPARPRPGAILEIRTSTGFGYFQAIEADPKYGYLVRVFPGSWKSRPSVFSALLSDADFYFVYFPLGPALRRGLVTIVGMEEIPERLRGKPSMRRPGGIDAEGRVQNWLIRDAEGEHLVKELSPEQARLSLEELWNDTLLAERIESEWRPELAR